MKTKQPTISFDCRPLVFATSPIPIIFMIVHESSKNQGLPGCGLKKVLNIYPGFALGFSCRVYWYFI